jgi:hypothetical protein
MRLKRSNTAARVCTLASFLVLSATALTATPALALPEGRVYEMVSPPYKGGHDVTRTIAAAPDGNSFAFGSPGAFDGVPSYAYEDVYLAQRTEGVGWSTTALQPPSGGVIDVSASLDTALATTVLGPNFIYASQRGTEQQLLLHPIQIPNTDENWEVLGGITMEPVEEAFKLHGASFGSVEQGASGDLCHVVEGNTSAALLPEAEKAASPIYDLSRGCGGEAPSLRLVGVKNQNGANGEPEVIDRHCPVVLGGEETVLPNHFNAVAAGGSEIFFTTCAGSAASTQVFVRLGGANTVEVSRSVKEMCPEAVPCPGAAERAPSSFQGADELGTKVFFTTTAPLDEAKDKDKANDLYMATIGCPGGEAGCDPAKKQVISLVQVSHDPNGGEAAEVQGVVRVASDYTHAEGGRVYFVARGVLTEGANAEGHAPVKGADNLYVYDSVSEKIAFVADLCSGPGESGAAEDARCPRNLQKEAGARNDTALWLNGGEVQSTADGGFLVFSTYGRLLKDDTDTAKDVYRYDAQTGVLDRVSLGEAGYDSNGNADAFDATINDGTLGAEGVRKQYGMDSRAISEDGSRILFSTAEPLSPSAANGLQNVYEWHKQEGLRAGSVSLISSGSSPTPDCCAVISPSGRDVFFRTHQGLVPQDTDGVGDIYDARLGGGFPSAGAQQQPCSADACQGPLTNPAPLLVPGSVSQAPGGNLAPPKRTTSPKKRTKTRVSAKKKRRKKKVNARRAARGETTNAGGGRR